MDVVVCKYCNKEIEKKFKSSLSAHYAKCPKWKEIKDEILKKVTKEYLIEEYINQGKSLWYLRGQLGLMKQTQLMIKLKEFEIPIRNLQEAKKQKHIIELSKITSKERYGYEFHLSKDCKEIRNKINDTVKKRYGVDNVYQAKEIKEKIKRVNLERYGSENFMSSEIGKKKFADACLKKYGVDNPWKNEEIIKKIQLKRFLNPKGFCAISKLSQELFWEIYNKLSEDDKKHVYFQELNKEFGKYTKEKYYYYDFVLTNKKKCIEFNGTYWHRDPRVHDESSIVQQTKQTAKTIWENMIIKINVLRNLNFDVLEIWELDYNKNKEEIINKCINFLIK